MSTTTPPNTPAPALAAAQHKAALWADDAQQVFAVVMGSRIPDLPALLADADVRDFDCLLPGALEPAQALSAPYLLQLKRDSAFTDWLLFEAPASLSDWGVLVTSSARLLQLRNHLRKLSDAQLPSGECIQIDWMDPEILLALLPLFDGSALSNFYGPVSRLVIASASTWHYTQLDMGRLVQRAVPLLKAA
ncbi:MAG TPA: DUF4123 domain-containing protein [Burkholderiaceae bacterium]|jgi:hypothetical protein